MGARWDGAFDQNDELYTFSFETKEEKVEADLKVLKERITEAGPLGLISLGRSEASEHLGRRHRQLSDREQLCPLL